MTEMTPFAGIKVLDTSHVLAGPFCSYQLGLLGAEVIRVDNPDGRDMVRYGGNDPKLGGRGLGPGFVMQNAGKRSISLNLKEPRAVDIFRKLADQSDVVVENFRPGVLSRLGIGQQDLCSSNERLIWCAITGFGQDGPMSENPAYDHIVQAFTGMMVANGDDSGRPRRIGFPLIDYIVGLLAAFAVSSALFERTRSGKGQTIDVSMLEAALVTMGPLLAAPLLGFPQAPRRGDRAASGSPFSGMFEAAGGIWLATAANTQRQAVAMAGALGRKDLTEDARFAAWKTDEGYIDDVQAALAGEVRKRDAGELEAALTAASVPAARVNSVADTLQHAQTDARGFLRDAGSLDPHGAPLKVPGVGFKLGDGDDSPLMAPPRPGQHNREILEELGYSREDIAQLEADRAIGSTDDD
jgi:CoA:oxalate CoA-transferase